MSIGIQGDPCSVATFLGDNGVEFECFGWRVILESVAETIVCEGRGNDGEDREDEGGKEFH